VTIEPYQVRIRQNAAGRAFVVEMCPRAGTWSPFYAAVPLAEKEKLNASIMQGPANRMPGMGLSSNAGEGTTDDGQWWVMYAQDEATPTQSYYLFVDRLPSRIAFGVHNGQPQYLVDMAALATKTP
jgi:hypothetical protein